MTAATVTPIRPKGGPKPPGPPTRPKRPRRAPLGVRLAESMDGEDFTTLDVLNALHGVCQVLDVKGDDIDVEDGELAIAAHVLASILQNRVD